VVLFWDKRHLACNHEIPNMIELRKVLGQEQIVILAMCNETAEHVKHLAAGRGVNFAVAAPVSGALPVPFGEETSIPANFFIDRSGIIKFAAEGLISLEKSGAAMEAA